MDVENNAELDAWRKRVWGEFHSATHDIADDLGVVLRTQIAIENRLNDLIDVLVQFPKYIGKMSLSFSDAILLAVGLGMSERLIPPLRCLGTIRNKVAHEFHYELTAVDMKNFYKSLHRVEKEAANEFYIKEENRNGPKKFTPLTKRSPKFQFERYTFVIYMALVMLIENTMKGLSRTASSSTEE